MIGWVLKKVMGTKHGREMKRLQPVVDAITALEPKLEKLSDEELRRQTADFKQQLENGASLDDILIPAFAACREGSRRSLGMRHYDVQLLGGMVLHSGKIAEMKTGEGKTLVATLACYLNALEGKGVHVVTVNDYLAVRDAEWMGKLYNFMGMSVGTVVHSQGDAEKKRAYRCDITYGQNNEFGFDYLRDNMKFSIYDYAQRDLHYAIVDEVDSILVDEARTPLIISGPGETASEKYQRIDEIIPRLRKDEHYNVDEKQHNVTLTEDGIEQSQRMLLARGLTSVENLYDPVNLESLHILQQALRAHALYKRDQHYMVTEDGKVLIIDEFTGRVLPGRRWSDGLHQAVEAKEHVAIEDENRTLATISFQNLFRLYKKLSGMTGTAETEAEEFHKIYKLDLLVIPTNKPNIRADHEDVIYKTEREKFKAVADEIMACREKGQPVLVGTTSVEKSDALARQLTKAGVPHNVLNAKQHEREAYVIAQAGRSGAVTVATNMAGRGTDILLGGNPEMLARLDVLQMQADLLAKKKEAERLAAEAEEAIEQGKEVSPQDIPEIPEIDLEAEIAKAMVRYKTDCEEQKKKVIEAGGLHILGTERHESRRIDNQLRGRGGRQGDPGSSRFYLSLEDDLMRIFAGERIQGLMERMGMEEGVPIEHRWVTKAVENAQKKVEERNFDIRKNLLEYDDVMNQQRKSVYTLRRQVLTGQYRTVPTEDEIKKGVVPVSLVEKADPHLRELASEVIHQMVRFHSSPLPAAGATPEEIAAHREKVNATPIGLLGKVRFHALEQDIYHWFGCRLSLGEFEKSAKGALELCEEEVAMSLSEQRERLLDVTDEIVGALVERSCPANKHFEDWDFKGMISGFEEQFGIKCTGIEGLGDPQQIAEKLYKDGEAVLLKKEKEIGPIQYLRLFRNFFLQEIDRQWIEHLTSMEHLRDGIGLRGYGQRDPKKEYKKEGFDLFLQMTDEVKASVCSKIFHVQVVREEDIARQEAERRRQIEARQKQIRTSHPDAIRGEGGEGGVGAPAARRSAPGGRPSAAGRRAAAAGGGGGGGGAMPMDAGPPPKVETVRRARPKVGRNDPCWCGSGKKYKQCHLREDQAAEASGGGSGADPEAR